MRRFALALVPLLAACSGTRPVLAPVAVLTPAEPRVVGVDPRLSARLDSIGRASREAVGTYNREGEARKLADEVRGASGMTMFAGAGMGLGVLMTALLTSTVADVTGILLATTLAATGLYVIPARRRQAKADFTQKIAELRTRLREALTRQVHAAVGESQDRVNESIAPYRRFVLVQQEQLNEARDELVTTEDALMRLRTEIEGKR